MQVEETIVDGVVAAVPKLDIKSMLPDELEESIKSLGEQSFRSRQVFRWLHSGVRAFDDMTDLPLTLREKLEEGFFITVPELIDFRESQRDGTIKYLWGQDDNTAIESAVMKYEHWNTVCISTQVGCRMGCVFCASAIGGLERNLTASEMLDQVIFSQQYSGEKISNVVLMGIGEPLDNYENVVRFLKLLTHPLGLNIGARHITLSTCGLVENIDKIAELGIQFTLSVSLHAPDDKTRVCLMPIGRSSGVDNLLCACKRYFETTGRRVSLEYALIDGVNDTPRHAMLLVEKIRKAGCHLNIILLNAIPGCDFKASPPQSVRAFIEILKRNGIGYTIRRSLGGEIDASCGQLRHQRKLDQRSAMNGTMGDN